MSQSGILQERGWAVLALVIAITIVALMLRLIDLTSIPTGLHGDEAIVGMEGQRVLRDHVIHPYSPSARGQPTAPFYLAALTVWIWDNTVLAVRMSAVIFGTLAIPALFLVARRSLATPVALLAATMLAVMGWHIHYARIAFPLPAWPLWVILTVGVLAHAIQVRSPVWWAAAGAMAGAGIYVYNAHPLTLLLLGVVAGMYLVMHGRQSVRDAWRSALSFGGAMLATLVPMIWFVLNNRTMYVNSLNRSSVWDSAEWQQLETPAAQAGFLLEQYVGYWQRLSFSPRVDYVDATGITPVMPILLLVLALAGLVIGLIRYRTPLVVIGVTIVLFMPIATVLTEQGEMRRTLVMAPFLAIFAALCIYEVIRVARRNLPLRMAQGAIVVSLVLLVTGVTVDLRNYFVVHGDSPTQHWIFAGDFYDASMFMQGLTSDHYVYFFSERWSIDYEPRRFLAPDVRGEDRSDEFGRFDLEIHPERGRPVFVLVGDYLPVLEALEERYPGGEAVAGSRSGDPSFIAYVVDE